MSALKTAILLRYPNINAGAIDAKVGVSTITTIIRTRRATSRILSRICRSMDLSPIEFAGVLGEVGLMPDGWTVVEKKYSPTCRHCGGWLGGAKDE